MDWKPFSLCDPGAKPPASRSMATPEGLGDRLRTAAFAELQAREAFKAAAERFVDAPAEMRAAWRRFSIEEGKHLGWLMRRMEELGVAPDGRPVSDGLFRSLMRCADWREFAAYMARAEDRGRTAERHFEKELAARDPATAAIFKAIADEEDAHIRAQTT